MKQVAETGRRKFLRRLVVGIGVAVSSVIAFYAVAYFALPNELDVTTIERVLERTLAVVDHAVSQIDLERQLAIDTCLDRGGRFNYAEQTCEYE